jgi:predicted permease
MPLVWAILGSVILSVTTLGPRYLYPGTAYAPNCDYVEYTGFIYLFFSYLAGCLEPLALFSVGIVLSKNNPLTCGIWNIVGYTLIKFILVPILMIGCSFALHLDNVYARGAVLIATLPISPPSFALAGHYQVGLAEAVSTVLSGKLLVIPAILAWQGFMDAVGLFPVDTPQVDDVCQQRVAMS